MNLTQQISEVVSNIVMKGKISIPRSYISTISYYIVPLTLLTLLLFPFGLSNSEIHSELGSIALVLVSIILFVKPLSILFKQIGLIRTILSFRRQLGVAALYFAIFHFLFFAVRFDVPVLKTFMNAISNYGPLMFGAVALSVMILLGMTSNRFSTKLLKRNWKRLHRLAYILLPVILIHVALVKGEREEVIQGIVLFMTYVMVVIAAKIKVSRLHS